MTDYKDLIDRLRKQVPHGTVGGVVNEAADALEALEKELNELWDSIIISPVKPPEDNQ